MNDLQSAQNSSDCSDCSDVSSSIKEELSKGWNHKLIRICFNIYLLEAGSTLVYVKHMPKKRPWSNTKHLTQNITKPRHLFGSFHHLFFFTAADFLSHSSLRTSFAFDEGSSSDGKTCGRDSKRIAVPIMFSSHYPNISVEVPFSFGLWCWLIDFRPSNGLGLVCYDILYPFFFQQSNRSSRSGDDLTSPVSKHVQTTNVWYIAS